MDMEEGKTLTNEEVIRELLELSDKSTQTGDTSNLALWIALLFASGVATIGTMVTSRKKKYNR